MIQKNVTRRSFLTTVTAAVAATATANITHPLENIYPQTDMEQVNTPGELKVGLFDVDATPPVGSLLTYDRMVNSSDLGLRAKGIILSGAGAPIVLCAVDWIGISNESQDLFKQSLASAAGTTPERVAVHTVHQHDAPICDFTAERLLKEKNLPVGCFEGSFARIVIKNIQEAIISAGKELQPVTHVGMGKAPIYEVASNRRVDKENGKIKTMRGSACKDPLLRDMPEGLIDPDVSLISFWNNDKPLAVLSFYATHPQSYYRTGIANPDFPGIARFLRQQAVPEALHVHFNGAGGNIAAGKYNDGSRENRLRLAERMADGMKRAWDSTKKYTVSSEKVKWTTAPLLLPVNPVTAEIEKNMATGDGPYMANNMGRLGWYKRALEGKTIDIGSLSIENAQIFFMPGELFVEYQLAAKKMSPDKFVAMAAYGDYGPFYIGTKEAYKEGGYEILSSPVTEDTEKVILKAIQSINDKL
ncbi:twin-arginine translocation signal domain-containing protein [Proteiniphilum sp.]|nr:twin-arginine translocation signal domain-containing protein [Proteiniphilum sp.]MEA4918768.1 twin-arginine translocation signal domain-containing protein [Proteiniphilum sp.]